MHYDRSGTVLVTFFLKYPLLENRITRPSSYKVQRNQILQFITITIKPL